MRRARSWGRSIAALDPAAPRLARGHLLLRPGQLAGRRRFARRLLRCLVGLACAALISASFVQAAQRVQVGFAAFTGLFWKPHRLSCSPPQVCDAAKEEGVRPKRLIQSTVAGREQCEIKRAQTRRNQLPAVDGQDQHPIKGSARKSCALQARLRRSPTASGWTPAERSSATPTATPWEDCAYPRSMCPPARWDHPT